MATKETLDTEVKPKVNQEHISNNDSLPREDLIETAIKFLNNLKVIQSPIHQKKLFLEKKGLTETEIDIAISRSKMLQGESKSAAPVVYYAPPVPNYLPPPVPVSPWSKFREIWYSSVIVGGTIYGVYMLTKKVIIPFLWGDQNKPDKFTKMEEQMNNFQTHLDQTVVQLQKTVEDLQTQVRETSAKQDTLIHLQNNSQSSKTIEHQFADIRAEILSLKGLLLNRHQFPTVPNIAPVIPSWQMEQSSVTEENGSEAVDGSNAIDESNATESEA